MTKIQFKHKQILEKLFSSKEEIVLDTLKELRETGDSSILYYVIQVLQKATSEKVITATENFLKDLRNQDSAQALVDAIQNEEFKNIQEKLVSICWQTTLDFSGILEPFISLVMFADYQTSVEAFTVIEEASINIKNNKEQLYISQIERSFPEDIDDIKKPLVKELIKVLSEK